MAKHEGKPTGLNFPEPPPGRFDEPDEAPSDQLGRLAASHGMVQTRTAHSTAIRVQVPRSLDEVERQIIHEAGLMGVDFLYSWEVNDKESKTGKSRIEDTSIDGALILYRNWGNCALPTELVDETPTHWQLKATFIDIEKGIEVERLFMQRKSQRSGSGMAAERAQDQAFQIGQSKVQRNAIVKGIPAWLNERAKDAARSAAAKKYEDVVKAVADFRRYAAKQGVTDDELQAKVGARFDDWVVTDCIFIASVFRSIAKKETTINLEFRPQPEKQPDAGQPMPAAPPTPTPSATSDLPDLPQEPKDRKPAAAVPAASMPADQPAPTPAPAQAPAAAPAPAAPSTPQVVAEPAPKPEDFMPPSPKGKK